MSRDCLAAVLFLLALRIAGGDKITLSFDTWPRDFRSQWAA
jgi:hypothetical protein